MYVEACLLRSPYFVTFTASRPVLYKLHWSQVVGFLRYGHIYCYIVMYACMLTTIALQLRYGNIFSGSYYIIIIASLGITASYRIWLG